MPNHTFVESCHKILLSDNYLNEMKKYISNLKKSDFKEGIKFHDAVLYGLLRNECRYL